MKAPAHRFAASHKRRGLSLLEVMIAIAILGVSLAAMGGLIRLGTRTAAESRDLTQAQILCEGKMSELAAGLIPPEAVEEAAFEMDPDWTYSVSVAPLETEGLLDVMVTVQQTAESGDATSSFTLRRWMIDPLWEQVEEPETILGGETTVASGVETAGQTGNQTAGGQNNGGQNNGGQTGGAPMVGGGNFGGQQGGPNGGRGGPGGQNGGRGGPNAGGPQGGRGGPGGGGPQGGRGGGGGRPGGGNFGGQNGGGGRPGRGGPQAGGGGRGGGPQAGGGGRPGGGGNAGGQNRGGQAGGGNRGR
jgi:prepilin-type N-terminal cleavage/methylation domain-containing protein